MPDDPHQKIGSLEMGEIEICCSPVKMKLFSILLTPFSYRLVDGVWHWMGGSTLDWHHSALKNRKIVQNIARQKNSWNQINQFREIAFLTVLNFFPLKKLIFGHFWNGKKWILVKKKFRQIGLFDFTSFFGLDFFKFSGPQWIGYPKPGFWKCHVERVKGKLNKTFFIFC